MHYYNIYCNKTLETQTERQAEINIQIPQHFTEYYYKKKLLCEKRFVVLRLRKVGRAVKERKLLLIL